MSDTRRPDNHCTECGKLIKPGREVMFELDSYTNKYHQNGIPHEGLSQGWFPFGADCAKKISQRKK